MAVGRSKGQSQPVRLLIRHVRPSPKSRPKFGRRAVKFVGVAATVMMAVTVAVVEVVTVTVVVPVPVVIHGGACVLRTPCRRRGWPAGRALYAGATHVAPSNAHHTAASRRRQCVGVRWSGHTRALLHCTAPAAVAAAAAALVRTLLILLAIAAVTTPITHVVIFIRPSFLVRCPLPLSLPKEGTPAVVILNTTIIIFSTSVLIFHEKYYQISKYQPLPGLKGPRLCTSIVDGDTATFVNGVVGLQVHCRHRHRRLSGHHSGVPPTASATATAQVVPACVTRAYLCRDAHHATRCGPPAPNCCWTPNSSSYAKRSCWN